VLHKMQLSALPIEVESAKDKQGDAAASPPEN